ncbi:MAG: hypothetical protein U9O98_01615 [Asgard group archaeon]|nr:hypothetical protein [Asgard group archaeon]
MASNASIEDLKNIINNIRSHGKTGNLRAVVQDLGQMEKITKNQKSNQEKQKHLAEAYRHAIDPMGVGKKFKEIDQLIIKIHDILQNFSDSEIIQEIYSEALNAAIFHYIKNERDKDIHKKLKSLGSFSCNHQDNPFVQFNYAQSLSEVAKYFAEKEDKEVTYNLLWEIIGIVTFYPGKEILTQVSEGLVKCINIAGSKLTLNELEDVASRIDEFINFTNEFETQQKLTTCQGIIFRHIAGKRMRKGFSPDGKVHKKYKKSS